MTCSKCGNSMRIARSTFESEAGSTDVYNVQLLACVNPECTDHEPDLENPTRVQFVRNKLN